MNSFYRKIGFGIHPNENIPDDPYKWALKGIEEIPNYLWEGKIPTELELRKFYGQRVYEDRKILRQKFKNDKNKYNKSISKLSDKTGQKFWQNLELCIRHKEAVDSSSSFLTRLWYFWGNHFSISKKHFLARYTTGAYQRETIRSNLNQTFEKMLYEATISWAMILHLDNSENIGPESESSKEDWRLRKKEFATINENHARELLELHSISSEAGYTQADIIQLAYILSGWKIKHGKKSLETGPVMFQNKYHQPNEKTVLGNKYAEGSEALKSVIRDLANHPSCRKFIAIKLCKHFLTDNPTKKMIDPIVKAWTESDGYLPAIHKATLKVVYENQNNHKKFQLPENWFLQIVRVCDMNWPHDERVMNSYKIGQKTNDLHREPEIILRELGHHPYLAKQPNGWSDDEDDWLSPELLIRRLSLAENSWDMMKSKNINLEFYENLILKNFNNSNKVLKILSKVKKLKNKHTILFNLPEMLKA